jgi:D-galactarolactone cycloisomerase
MEITEMEAIPLSHSLGEGRALGSSRGLHETRTTALLRLETDTGIVGWGEAFAPGRTAATLLEEMFADRVLGMDPFEVESFAERSYMEGYHFGGSAFVQSAVSAVDVALWDIIGKEVGRPVHTLLGGRSRESLTPYASTGYFTEGEGDIAEPIERAVEEGFTAAKIKIGSGVEDDVERVRTTREILGDDAHLMVDFNGNYRPKQVLRAVDALEPFDLTWIEEPVPAENLSGYRQLRETVDVPVAAGEAHYGRFEFKRLIDDRLVDIVQPNLGRCGGLSEARLIADVATTENVGVYPHVWNSAVGLAAAVQFAASLPEYPHPDHRPVPLLFEFDRSENPLRDDLLVENFDPTGGSLDVPQAPGLGIEVDESVVEEYRLD